MNILLTAIEANRLDLAAHALVLAAILTLKGDNEHAEKINPQPSVICQEKERILH